MTNSKIWFITGSSRGLGRELARAVLAAGHRVVATARTPSQLQFLVDEFGDRVRTVALDVTDPAAARAAVGAALSAFGRIDVAVNNAGYANVSSIEDADDADFRAQFETNFFGVVNVTRAVLPVMREQGGGRIIQVSSIGGRMGSPGLGSYQSAKWAVGGLTEVLAAEVAHLGIKVTAVEPGGMKTDWAGSSMSIKPVSPAYRPTVGAMWQGDLRKTDGVRGDPHKAALAILALAELADPPTHLLLGTDALFLAKMISEKRAADDATHRALSASIDADGLGDFADTRVAQMLVASNRKA